MAAVIAFAMIAAIVAGITVYFKVTDSNLSLKDFDANDVLVYPENESVFLTLCSASIGRNGFAVPDENKLAIMLARVDLTEKSLAFVTIPSSLMVKVEDLLDGQGNADSSTSLSLATIEGDYGEAALIKAVSYLTGTDINHFISTDSKGIVELVETVDGLDFDLDCEIDDPNAGVIVLEAGQVELDGEKAVTMLRADNIKGGFDATAQNRVDFTIALLSKALDPEGLGFANVLSTASKAISTDMDTRYLLDTGDKLRPLGDFDITSSVIPYASTTSVVDGKKIFSYSLQDVRSYMRFLMQGEGAGGQAEDLDSIDKAGITVEIRNGAAIDGAAGALRDRLATYGYAVGEVGNTNDSTIYPETLIIYTNPENELAARALQRDINAGRVVNGGDFYSTSSDVLVVIGSDWR